MSSIINATTTNGLKFQPDNSGSLVLQTNNGTTAVTVDTSQNVGIGTSSPTQRLQVDSTSATSTVFSRNGGTNANTNVQFKNSTTSFYLGTNTSGNFSIKYNDPDLATSPNMVIDSSGNVGIGTTSPSTKLHVVGQITATQGVGGTPAFSAYLGSNQSITSGVFTKIQFNTEAFDTNNNYDNTTNYRFTPTVAGYYQINGKFASTVNTTLLVITMYKNGSEFIRGGDNRVSQNAGSSVQVNAIVYMNGTTDYLELYGYIAGTSPAFQAAQSDTYFQAYLARSA